MHLQPEKVTSTCSQRFAELDPCCPGMLEAACGSFRAGADASRLSLEVLRRLSSKLGALCRQSTRAARHPHDQTDGPEGADIPRGQSLAVTVAASTRQTWFLVSVAPVARCQGGHGPPMLRWIECRIVGMPDNLASAVVRLGPLSPPGLLPHRRAARRGRVEIAPRLRYYYKVLRNMSV